MWKKREEAFLVLIFSTKTNCKSMAYWCLNLLEFEARGVRKVSKGIIGLWLLSVHNALYILHRWCCIHQGFDCMFYFWMSLGFDSILDLLCKLAFAIPISQQVVLIRRIEPQSTLRYIEINSIICLLFTTWPSKLVL